MENTQEPIIEENKTLLSRINHIDDKLDQVLAFIKEVQAQTQRNLAPTLMINNTNSNCVDFIPDIRDIDNYIAALEALNQAGNAKGFSFKKGQMKKYAGKPPQSLSIICKYGNRNKGKDAKAEDLNSDCERELEREKKLIKEIDCKVRYTFQVNKDSTITLTVANQIHNHGPVFPDKTELSNEMKLEIKNNYTKRDKVSDVKLKLELKFDIKLDYWSVYSEFMKQHPRLGQEDCQNFINFLLKNDISYRQSIDPDNSLCKLVFITKRMLLNYQKFYDIILIDSTYNTNYYSIPLVLISGIDNNMKNVIFAIALINDETKETYQWIWRQFLELTQIKPKLVISDNENSIVSSIESELDGSFHRLCAWHMSKNFRKNFNFIPSENQELKEKIFNLPYETNSRIFDQNVSQITKFLKENRLNRSLDYFNKSLEIKEKWARSKYPICFEADMSTTSRAESLNASIKKYLNSKSEISDLIDFISESEKDKSLQSTIELSKFVDMDPLLFKLQEILPPKVFTKQFEQYVLAKKYKNLI